MNQLFRRKTAVVFRVLQLSTELRRTASLKDHWRLCRRQVPTRCAEIERAVIANSRCARWHMQSRLVFHLMTISALECKDALSVNAATQTKTRMWLTIFASQWCVASRMTIDAAWVHEHLIGFFESCSGGSVVLRLE